MGGDADIGINRDRNVEVAPRTRVQIIGAPRREVQVASVGVQTTENANLFITNHDSDLVHDNDRQSDVGIHTTGLKPIEGAVN